MWVITVYSKGNITMFELDTEKEAREAFKNIKGYKILSEVVYFNDPCFAVEAV
jgi:ArsR family metal-binding transcriptional regulator